MNVLGLAEAQNGTYDAIAQLVKTWTFVSAVGFEVFAVMCGCGCKSHEEPLDLIGILLEPLSATASCVQDLSMPLYHPQPVCLTATVVHVLQVSER